ncbi:amino acid permease-domain-containing protein [Neurospora tetraspora]|uniref:Amino acid permease-domain-containing protein n=1 Tax=Neurospora tetraspora TaxID=94610 RepID=A0AAE0J7Y0_9PEZI|nr:amino acid permease-domain-containing protein [Neurospora tetraspora]
MAARASTPPAPASPSSGSSAAGTPPGSATKNEFTKEQFAVDDDAPSFAEQNAGPELKRRLKSRHLQMIAIGGTIGTGLFIGSGSALAKSGPGGILIAYCFIASIVYSIMMSLGEMATYIPVTGGFTTYAARFVDRSLGFSMSWIYWFSWAITFALELVATGLIIQYWNDSLSIGIFIAIFWVVIFIINMFPVSWYGEAEFWMSSIKVITVIGFLIFGICINAGAGQLGYIGFKYWHEPGAFAPYIVDPSRPVAKWVGFWSVMIQAGFSFQGTELVGIAAGETEDPRRNVPRAIRMTFYRIFLFFIMTVFFIGILIPYDNKDLNNSGYTAAASPFVIAAQLAGVKVLPDIINAVLLTVVLSAANSNVYSGSRILVSLANDGMAPKWFKLTTKQGVPWVAVIFTSVFGFLGFLNLSENGSQAFNWLLNISGVAGFIAWSGILIAHLRFMKGLEAQNIPRAKLPYTAALAPYYAYYALFFCVLITLTQGFTAFMPWSTEGFFVAYISLILFAVMYLGHKLFTLIVHGAAACKPVAAKDMDLTTGSLDLDVEIIDEVEEPTSIWKKIGTGIMG